MNLAFHKHAQKLYPEPGILFSTQQISEIRAAMVRSSATIPDAIRAFDEIK